MIIRTSNLNAEGKLGPCNRGQRPRSRAPRVLVAAVAMMILGGCDWLYPYRTDEGNDLIIDSVIFEKISTSIPAGGTDSFAPARVTELEVSQGETVIIDLVVTAHNADGTSLSTIERFSSEFLAATNIQIDSASGVSRGDDKTFRKRYTFEFTENYVLNTTTLIFGINVQETHRSEGSNRQHGTQEVLPVILSRRVDPASAATPREISAGQSHSLALSSDGSVWGWGGNDENQIDDLTFVDATSATRIDIPAPIMHISAGNNHSLAVSTSGSVYSWGANDFSQLGSNRANATPELIPGLSNMFDVFAGNNVSFALSADLTLYAWGNNAGFLLGLPGEGIVETPTIVPIDRVVKIATGLAHVLALTADGEVFAWGERRYGQHGGFRSLESSTLLPHPVLVPTAVDIAASRDATFILFDTGQVLFFGRNQNRLFLDIPSDAVITGPPIPGVDDAIAITASSLGDSLVITRRSVNGDVYYSVLGRNDTGQLTLVGVDTTNAAISPGFPATPTMVAMSENHGLFLQQEGTCGAVWAWGSSADGRLGRGLADPVQRETPYPVPNLGAASCSILTVSTDNSGGIGSTPGAIDCGVACADSFLPGESVTLDATQQAANFLGFDGDCSIDGAALNRALPLSLDMDNHKYCPATFSAASGNVPPVSAFTFSPVSPVTTGTEVSFDGTSSSDSDGSVTIWEWDFEGNGTIDGSGSTAAFTYAASGSYDATLRVTDDGGLTDTTSRQIQVSSGSSALPIAAFTVSPPLTTLPGTELTFDASISSDDVGIVSWQWDFENDGSFNDTGEKVSYTPPNLGLTDILLRVIDTDGQFDEVIQSVDVSGSDVSFALRVILTGSGQVSVTPPGLTLPNTECDGNECFIFDIGEGSVLDIRATAFTPAAFAGWSSSECDSVVASANQCIITLTSDRTVTATFQ